MYKTATKQRRKPNNRKRNFHRKGKSATADFSRYTNEGKTNKKEEAVYQNQHTFKDWGLDVCLFEKIDAKGFTKPSEIHVTSILPALEGNDIVGIAGTGTGKTSAFLIPIIQQLIKQPVEDYAMIITPTRELANQINAELRSLVKGMDIFSTCLIGGTSVGDNLRALRRKKKVRA